MRFIIDDKQSVSLSINSEKCKLTKGLHTTLYLNGLGFWNLQPKYAFMFGGAEAFCKAWSCYMHVDFDGDVEKFYNRFDFDLIEKAEELTKLIQELVNRDIEPVEEISTSNSNDDSKTKKTNKRKS